MHVDRDSVRTAVSRETVRRASKVALGAASLVVVLALASVLPGADLVVGETGVSLGAILTAFVTAAVVGLLAYLAPGLAALTRVGLDGPRPVVENVASVVYWLVVLAAVLVAHAGFEPAVAPLLGDAGWLYDLAFLLAGLVPLVVVAARLSATVDPAADHLADSVVERAGTTETEGERRDQEPTSEA